MNENLKLWNNVEKTNPAYTKKAKIGGMSITAIAPQYQIMMVTEQFGVYGRTWGFKNIELDYSLTDKYDLVVFKGTFFFPEGEFEIINSIKMYINNAKTMLDDNFAKKIETDALTKAISKLGFNADIFLGKFDDVRYLEEVKKEFTPKNQGQKLSERVSKPNGKQVLTHEGFEFLKKEGTLDQVKEALSDREITDLQKSALLILERQLLNK
jgi:hypothetical protein